MIEENTTISNRNILRAIQQENVSLETIVNFRKCNRNTSWTNLIYKQTGDSILHIAARLGQDNIVQYILSSWPPHYVNLINNDSKTPLHEASQFCHYKIVKQLLKHGAQINAIKRADWTPLMLACTKSGSNAYETVHCLLSNGASLQILNKDGWSALHVACRTGDHQILELLLQSGSDIVQIRTNNGRTILHIACLHGHLELVKLILQQNIIDIDVKDMCGNTVLHDGVCSGNVELVQYLRNKNCNINCINNANLSCLHLAASEGLLSMIDYLITELQINPNILTKTQITPLHCAGRNKQYEAFRLLMELGADSRICDSHGRTPDEYYSL